MLRVTVTVVAALTVIGAVYALTRSEPPGAPITAETTAYDPFQAGEELPDGFRQLLRRDGIPPIYDPDFVPPADAGWAGDTLVIGVAIDGDARAYPVSHLNRHEMVIDRVAGIPVLVTW